GCAARTTAFSWTNAVFPFMTGKEQPFHLVRRPVVTVIGKAFYDTDHSGKELHNNRRPTDKDKAVWEIHPVMALEVENSDALAAPPSAPAQSAPTTTAPVSPPVASVAPQKFVTITRPVTI